MLIGYQISGHDNDSYMLADPQNLFTELDIPKCNNCGLRLDYRYNNPFFKLKRKTYDYSYTYDGIQIVSLKFKEFCNRHGYSNIKFIDLERVLNFYQINILENYIPFNVRETGSLCKVCKQHHFEVGPSPNLELISEPLKDGFYQSDKWFGSGNAKSPITIISPVTKEKLDKEKFKNIVYTKIEK